MGNHQSFDRGKRKGAIKRHKLMQKCEAQNALLDVNIATLNIKSSIKHKNKKMEKSSQADFENRRSEMNELSTISSTLISSKNQEDYKDQNGSTVHFKNRKTTLLERATLSQDEGLNCGKEPSSDNKECVTFNLDSDKVKKSCFPESMTDQFSSSQRCPGASDNGQPFDKIIANQNNAPQIGINIKSEADEKEKSRPGNKTEVIDTRSVTIDSSGEAGAGVVRLKSDGSEKLMRDANRPVLLPVDADYRDKLDFPLMKNLNSVDCITEEQRAAYLIGRSKYFDSSNRCSKDGLTSILRSQKATMIGRALQSLKVTPLDSKLYIPDSLEMGINKNREIYPPKKIVDLLLNPGTLINLVGCHGSGKSEMISVTGLQLVKNKKVACITIDCHGCNDDRSVVRCLLRTFNLNFSPLPDELLAESYWSQNHFNKLTSWLCNYICFHGQIQSIILMIDGLDVRVSLGRNFVDKLFIPLMEKCSTCLSILLCSSVSYLSKPEEALELNERFIKITDGHPYKYLFNCSENEKSIDTNQFILNDKGLVNLIKLYAFKLPSLHNITSAALSTFIFSDLSVDDEETGALAQKATELGVTLSAGKVLARGAAMKPGSLHYLLQKAESCSHPSLIVLENEFVAKYGQIEPQYSHSTTTYDCGNRERFKIERMNACVVLAALEILDDDEQFMATILWLMSDFKTGFDRDSVVYVMSTCKFLQDDLKWKASLSEKIETDTSDNLKDSQEYKEKIFVAVTKLVDLNLLQTVKSPITFSSPLSSRRESLIDCVAKPSRLLDQSKCFTEKFDTLQDKFFLKYRIPNYVLPIARSLRPDFIGRPSLVLDYLMAKKLTKFYQMFYTSDSFSNIMIELDSFYSDFIRCLERSFSDLDPNLIKNPVELKISQPLIYACQCLVSLPGAFFLAHILPLSTYMKIFLRIFNAMKQKSFLRNGNSRDYSLEYRALLCVILRHKMLSPDGYGRNSRKDFTTANGLILNTSQSQGVTSNCNSEIPKPDNMTGDCPPNLLNFAGGISGCSNLSEATLSDMIARIKYQLFKVNRMDRAYFYYVMGLHAWPNDGDHSVMLMKKSLDLFKDSNLESGDDILSNFGQVNVQIVSETYSWMLLNTDRVQAARHMYNLSDSLFSTSSSPISQSTFPQNSFPASSSSSSYYSLHSHRGSSPGFYTSRSEEIDDAFNSATEEDNGKEISIPAPPNGQTGRNDAFFENKESSDSPDILGDCRNTLKSLSDHNFYSSKSPTSKGSVSVAENHPLKLRGLESRRKIWSDLGLLSRARDTSMACVELSRRWWGQNHPSTAEALMGQCLVAEKLGRNHEAIDACVQALLSRLKIFGDKHRDSIEACVTLSRLLLKCSMYDECLELARRAMNMCSYLTPCTGCHFHEVENILLSAEKRLKSGKQKRDSTTVTVSKSVTFPDELFVEAIERKQNFVNGGGISSDGRGEGKCETTCSSAICKFDPELAQTFHRCI